MLHSFGLTRNASQRCLEPVTLDHKRAYRPLVILNLNSLLSYNGTLFKGVDKFFKKLRSEGIQYAIIAVDGWSTQRTQLFERALGKFYSRNHIYTWRELSKMQISENGRLDINQALLHVAEIYKLLDFPQKVHYVTQPFRESTVSGIALNVKKLSCPFHFSVLDLANPVATNHIFKQLGNVCTSFLSNSIRTF